MKDGAAGFWLLVIVSVIVLVGVFILGHNSCYFVESKKRITPDLHIEYRNGVTDTTFIYRVK